MKKLILVLALVSAFGIISGLSGCGNNESTEGPVSIPPETQVTSPSLSVSDVPSDDYYDYEEAVWQSEGYSLSAEIEWSATGKKVSIQRDDPQYAEFTRLFHYSAFGSPTSRTAKTVQNENQETIAVTIPYARGYVLTFSLKNSSIIWFNCSSENIWYESKDAIYKGGFDAEFRSFLEAMLADNIPNSPSPDITILPEPGQYLYYDSRSSIGTTLRSVSVRLGVLEKDYMTLFMDQPIVKKGEPCWLVTGQIESQLESDKYMTMYAKGFDVNGQEVAHVLDAGPIIGIIAISLPAKGFGGFILHLNAAPEVTRIELYPSKDLSDIPPL
jgi:hypothetical protein